MFNLDAYRLNNKRKLPANLLKNKMAWCYQPHTENIGPFKSVKEALTLPHLNHSFLARAAGLRHLQTVHL